MARTLIIRTARSRLHDGTLKSNLGDLLRSTVATKLYGDWLFVTDETGRRLLAPFLPEGRVVGVEELPALMQTGAVEQIALLDNHLPHPCLAEARADLFAGHLPNGEDVVPVNAWMAILSPYRMASGNWSWQEALVRGLGFHWREQDYPEPEMVEPIHDVGLNHHVHEKWLSKSWPGNYWIDLAARLGATYDVRFQQGENSLERYMKWIRSCRVIVTCDSLGLHLGSAFRRKVVALTGPTESREFPYSRLVQISPGARKCLPCHAPVCSQTRWCMEDIVPEDVALRCRELLDRRDLHA